MAETIDVPGIGPVKTQYVYIGLAAAGGIVAWAWWRYSQDGGGTGTAEPDYFADLRTGSEVPNGAYVNPGGESGDSSAGSDAQPAPKTNQEWAQRAVEKLHWYEPGYVSSVTGKYLDRRPLPAAEAQLIREIWAQIGHPPSGMIPIIAETVTVTPVPTPVAKPAVPGGLRVTRADRMQIEVSWSAVAGATSYAVTRSPGAGVFTMTGTRQLIAPLTPGTRYGFRVMAKGPGGNSAWSGTVYGTTKR